MNFGSNLFSIALGDRKCSFGCIKLILFVHLAAPNLQKCRKIPKFVGLKLFEGLSNFDETKTFVILLKIRKIFASTILFNLLLFEISSFKNADFCLGVQQLKSLLLSISQRTWNVIKNGSLWILSQTSAGSKFNFHTSFRCFFSDFYNLWNFGSWCPRINPEDVRYEDKVNGLSKRHFLQMLNFSFVLLNYFNFCYFFYSAILVQVKVLDHCSS